MGTVRLGNHELLIRLAAGGAANVFLVRDLEHENRLLALKILLPSLAQNDDFLNMFFTEAKIASHLRHANIVTIAGFGQVDGIHCLAMEYVFGASLSQVLRASARAKKPLTVGVLLRLTASVCDALHYAHELADENGEPMGLVHRDVTPQNILIGFNGVPKLTDFGIAKATNRGWETQAGIVKGKFSYMSPEQALGKAVDRRSDIFGAGIVLWEALTGRDLFKGSTPMEVLSAIREQKIEPPSKVVPGLTPIVDPIVMKALRRSPRQRYATAADMRDEIEELINRAGVQIDADTISKEFAQIYGDEIGKRALALKQAIMGSVELEELAKALGGTVLNSQQLPVMQGGLNDPDPLGLFTAGNGDIISDEASGALPARIERSFSEVRPVDDADVADDDDDLLDLQPSDDAPHVPDNRLVTGWDDSTSTAIPEDELLSMISEEDATIGYLPPQFAERFGQALKDALEEEPVHFEDERTVGVPDATLSRLRAISSEDSINEIEPELLKPFAAELANHFGTTPNARPVPRAPSVLMEEQARLKDRFVPRAPSWDMPSTGTMDSPFDDGARPSRPPLSSPPPPPAAGVSVGGSALLVRDDAPAPAVTLSNDGLSVQQPSRSIDAAAIAELEIGDGLDGSASQTDRASVPLPFGTYSFTRNEKKAWSTSEEAAMPPPAPPPVPPPIETVNQRPEPLALQNSASVEAAELPPESGQEPPKLNADWAEPSPMPELKANGLARSTSAAAIKPVERIAPPARGVQISVPMLVILALILLGAGAALGVFLGNTM